MNLPVRSYQFIAGSELEFLSCPNSLPSFRILSVAFHSILFARMTLRKSCDL
jgi:hypothetical protein